MEAGTRHGLGGREESLRVLGDSHFDVLIVGGGITGAGIALDLSARGLSVGLLEQEDFAAGTSSRSSKLVHGGLRYLAQLQFGVTRESIVERTLLQKLAPGLVTPLPFVIPIFDRFVDAARIGLGLALYDLFAGAGNTVPFGRLSPRDLARLAPGIRSGGLITAFIYYDCRTDDARLTLAVLREARRRGAVLVNHLRARRLLDEDGRAAGVEAHDGITDRSVEIRARVVVLATGAWGNSGLPDRGEASAVRVRPSKGVHLLFSRERIGFRTALYLPTGVDDRLVFVVPWEGRTLVGTTDTEYTGSLDRPMVEPADAAYLIDVVNRSFPALHLQADDVVGAQAGLRPLVWQVGSTSSASREDRIWTRPDGAIAIAGGKLTTYRRIAEKVAIAIAQQIAVPARSPTSSISLVPAQSTDESPPATRLRVLYGPDAAMIAGLHSATPDLALPIVAGQAPTRAEVVYSVRHEQARSIADVLARRTRLLILDHAGAVTAADDVAQLMASELGWDGQRRETEMKRFRADAEQYAIAASSEPASV